MRLLAYDRKRALDPDKLSRCYAKHHRRFYLVALAITMNREAAEDAVHDALERLLRAHTEPGNIFQYALRAVRNAAIDLMTRRRHPDSAKAVETLLTETDDVPHELDMKQLNAALLKLSRDEREVIWLHVYADLPFREIAELRDAPLNSVTSWYRRGIAKLRSLLEDEDVPIRTTVAPCGTNRTIR